MKYVIILLLIFPVVSFSKETVYTITAEEWARPRNGETLVKYQALSMAVKELMDSPKSLLVIQHPGGDDGSIWGQELHDWLVSLGISSRRLQLRPGMERDDVIILFVEIITGK
ncbi:MAG: hypothetical protein BMS9Abin26_0102 [Gammaproteobacteria bacterium]|nr:MAG: hypothetical protein BMS9Abin26_0102 [Gammaproteobacteria bacterium]